MPYIGTQPTKVVSRQSANVYRYEATAGQTVFTGADLDNNVLACNPADLVVHMNGLRLESTDYTATTSSVTLTTAATAGDELTVTSFQTFEVADTYTKTAADNRYVNASGDTMTGNLGIGDGNPSNHYGEEFRLVLRKDQTSTTQMCLTNATVGTGAKTQYKMIGGTGNSFAGWVLDDSNGSPYSDLSFGNAVNHLQIGLGGAERMRIDSAGRVTMPYQPAFKAGMNANTFSTPTNSGTITYNHIMFNSGNHYSTSTGRFTCPVDGVYQFTHHVTARTSSTLTYEVKLHRNGVEVMREFTKANGSHGYGATLLIDANANDYIEATGYWTPSGVTLSGNLDINSGDAGQGVCSYFSGYLIG